MKAVHFGAGNIGRGFVGLLLHEAGYEVVFADVASELIERLNAADGYTVHEVGEGARDHQVSGVRALDSGEHPDAVVAEIADADIVTTAVGVTVLPFIAPLIAGALSRREASRPLVVLACENAIGATGVLRQHVVDALGADAASALDRAVFADTAVDRIVPGLPGESSLDVTVEPYFEWAIDRRPLGDIDLPNIPGVTWVDDLTPTIERKLFTVNTGHATIAYYGFQAGAATIAEALRMPEVEAAVRDVLAETGRLLTLKHGLDPDDHQGYVDRILVRFANPHLPDTVERVGRQPLRKLSRHDRFVGPAADLAERGIVPTALVAAVGVALGFDVPSDEQSVRMLQLIGELTPEEFVAEVCGLDHGHPLFAPLAAVVPSPSP